MYLYHFSEEADIEIFHPRKIEHREDVPPLVWGIDEEHAVNYFFPRDCPRVIFRRSEKISKEDELRFFKDSVANTIIVVENDWVERILNTELYKYTFRSENFELNDGTAGYYTSRVTVEPIKVEPVGNLLQAIINQGVELRITPNLYPLREAIIQSTMDDFSMIRFRNAMQLNK